MTTSVLITINNVQDPEKLELSKRIFAERTLFIETFQ